MKPETQPQDADYRVFCLPNNQTRGGVRYFIRLHDNEVINKYDLIDMCGYENHIMPCHEGYTQNQCSIRAAIGAGAHAGTTVDGYIKKTDKPWRVFRPLPHYKPGDYYLQEQELELEIRMIT